MAIPSADLPDPPESVLLAQCLQALAAWGILAWRTNSGAMTVRDGHSRRHVRFSGAIGQSDICAVLPGGRACFCEIKRRNGRLSAAQANFLKVVGAAGALAFVARSVKELEEALRKEGILL